MCKTLAVSAGRQPTIPRLSAKELLILELLVQQPRMYGLELVAGSGGELKRGTVYVTLGRMEEKGYLTSEQEAAPPAAGGLPRRVYQATALGRRVFEAWAQVRRRLAPGFAQ
jgi:DNA-binding PadR family transcriptional regulator